MDKASFFAAPVEGAFILSLSKLKIKEGKTK